MSANAIEINNISKEFYVNYGAKTLFKQLCNTINRSRVEDKIVALKDIDFSVKKGEIFGVIGPNGSGKTTLLKIIAGIIQASNGSVAVWGEINCFFQWGLGFHPDLSIRDNIYLYGSFLGIARRDIMHKLDKIIYFAQLHKDLKIKLRGCSTGMLERLAFAVATEAKADIWVMDEFLDIGDLDFRKRFFATFEHLKEKGCTLILASHNLDIIEKFCQRVLFLKEGRQIVVTEAQEAIDRYKTS